MDMGTLKPGANDAGGVARRSPRLKLKHPVMYDETTRRRKRSLQLADYNEADVLVPNAPGAVDSAVNYMPEHEGEPPAKKKKKRSGKKRSGSKECPVCHVKKSTALIWPCKHRACKPCIRELETRTCPVCKEELKSYAPERSMGGEKWNTKPKPLYFRPGVSVEARRLRIQQLIERRAILFFSQANGFHALDLSSIRDMEFPPL